MSRVWHADLHERKLLSHQPNAGSCFPRRIMWCGDSRLPGRQLVGHHRDQGKEGMRLGVSVSGLAWRGRSGLEKGEAAVPVRPEVLVPGTAVAHSLIRSYQQTLGLAQGYPLNLKVFPDRGTGDKKGYRCYRCLTDPSRRSCRSCYSFSSSRMQQANKVCQEFNFSFWYFV